MKAAVLHENRAMGGTFSHRITALAMSFARVRLSVNVPAVAYTSIMGIGLLLQSLWRCRRNALTMSHWWTDPSGSTREPPALRIDLRDSNPSNANAPNASS